MFNSIIARVRGLVYSDGQNSEALIVEQHRIMAKQLPSQYMAAIISLLCIMTVNMGTAPSWLSIYLPVTLILFGVARLRHWIHANRVIDSFTLKNRKKDMVMVAVMAPLTTTILTIITAFLLQYGELYQQALTLALAWGTVAISCYAMSAVPVASISAIIFSTIPIMIALLYTRDYTLGIMAVGFGSFSLLSVLIMFNSFKAIRKLVETRADLSARHIDIERLANTDPLTGLANRYSFNERLKKRIISSERFDRKFAVIVLDLDSFKHINTLFCHLGGDMVLKKVGVRLKQVIGEAGTVARLSSDEFHIIASDVCCEEDAEKLGRDIHNALRTPFFLKENPVHISASIGMALYPDAGVNPGELVKRAALAQNRAKLRGGGKTCIFSMEFEDEIMESSRLELDLKAAIRDDEIEVYFQPIVDIQTGRFASFETLARWPHPKRGFIPPDIFIKIAENKGLIEDLTIKLMRKATAVAVTWPSDVMLSFNLSAEQVCNPNFALTILAILNESGLPPNRFEIELTETAIMEDMDKALITINNLREVGISISLDDFGTGYSSLSQIKNIPLDKLKIDKSFIDDICISQKMENIVRAILGMCDVLELKTVSEGVETAEQLEALQKAGGSLGQGYLFSKPMPADQLSKDFFYSPLKDSNVIYEDAA